MRKLVMLLPIAVVFAAGLFAAGVARPAAADVQNLQATSTTPAVGTPVTITAQINLSSPAAITAMASVPSFTTATLGSGEIATGLGSNLVSFPAGTPGTKSLTLTYTCAQAGPSTITVSHQGANPAVLTLNCGAGAASGTGLTVTPINAGTGATINGTCTSGTQLALSGPANFTTVTINGQTVAGAGSASVACSTTGAINATAICTSQGAALFSLGGSTGSMTCTGPGTTTCAGGSPGLLAPGIPNPVTCPTPQAIGAATTATTITVTAAPTTIGCTGTSSVTTITVSVKGANGITVADKTPVTVSADAGVVSAPSLQTKDGVATTPYTAPSSSSTGTVTIRATSGGATGQTTVNLSCGGSSVPSAITGGSAPPPPPPPVAGSTTDFPTLRPPNTGDAGLKAALESTID